MQKGNKHTKETKEKMREAALKRCNRNRIASLPRGEKHHGWSKEPNILTLHKRIHRKHGAAKEYKCDCGKQARDWALIDKEYTDDVNDYTPMCRSCHVKKDKNWIKK